jgi:ubiquinone/menaquinone biosynthesis C-methylase UbiE
MGAPTDRYAKGFSDLADVYVDLTAQATRLVDLADIRPGESVLDVGCGPGTAAIAAADRTGPAGHVVGVDLAPNMLAIATERTADQPNVTIREMDAIDLDFADGTFDVVVANSVAQFTGVKSIPEWQRVAEPDGGRVACSLPWGPVFWTELCSAHVHRTAEPFRSMMQPRLAAARRPLDPEAVRARNGFTDLVAEVQPIVRRYESPEAAWEAEYTHGARVFLEELPEDALDEFKRDYLEAVRADDGAAEIPVEFHYWCFTR